jgi:hypothetical protein
MNKYKFFSDPSHGYIEVPLAELQSLGIDKDISSYSYANNGLVYLEEDCDYSVFIEAKAKANEPFDYDMIHLNDDAPCRGYPRYKPTV